MYLYTFEWRIDSYSGFTCNIFLKSTLSLTFRRFFHGQFYLFPYVLYCCSPLNGSLHFPCDFWYCRFSPLTYFPILRVCTPNSALTAILLVRCEHPNMSFAAFSEVRPTTMIVLFSPSDTSHTYYNSRTITLFNLVANIELGGGLLFTQCPCHVLQPH